MSENLKETILKLCAKLQIIAVCFTIFCSVILLADYVNSKSAEKGARRSLNEMRAQITKTPDDAVLVKKFTELDLIYRRATLVSASQRKFGAMLTLMGLGVIFASSALRFQLAPVKIERPESDIDEKDFARKKTYRKSLKVFVAILALSALIVVGFLKIGRASSDELAAQSYTSRESLAENWCGFRGGKNDGTFSAIANFKSLPLVEKWRAKIALGGYGSPAIFGDKIFVGGSNDAKRGIFCYEKNSGKLLWEASLEDAAKVNHDEQTGAAPSTVAVDGDRTYAVFPTGELFCVNHSGKILWIKKFGDIQILYGYASSLIICGKELIAQFDTEKTHKVIAFDSASGRELWTCQRESSPSWSSPTLVEWNGKRIIVVCTSSSVMAVDLADGKMLWEEKCISGEMATSIAFGDGKIFAANDNCAAVALDVESGKRVWSNNSVVLPSVASPVYANGELYLFSSGGTVSRLNAADGKLIKEYETEADGFYSSPVFVGGYIFAGDVSGKFYVAEAGEKFELKERLDFQTPIYATPAFTGQNMFMRVGDELICFGGDK